MAALFPAMIAVALAAPSGAALVVTSPDSASAGGLQRRLETKLIGAVVPGETLSKRLALPATPPAADPVLQREAERLLEATQKAFYDGNFEEALARIDELDVLTVDAPALPMRVRGRMLLWRAAVFLEVPATKAAADAPLREALAFVPDLAVDERSFPPPLVTLATRVRKSRRMVTVTISGLPTGASLRVDDLDVPAPATEGAPFLVAIPGGRHRLQAWSAGWETSTVTVDFPLDVSLTLNLPLGLEPADKLAFRETVAGRAAKDRLESLGRRFDVATLAVVTQPAAGEPYSAFVWHAGLVESAPAFAASPAGEDALALWLAQRVGQKSSRAPRVQGKDSLVITPSVAAIGAMRAYDVVGKGGSYGAMFGGAGARVTGAATWKSWLASAEATYVSYAISPVTAELADGGRARGNGGSTAMVLATGGWRLRRAGIEPYVAAGGSFERHAASDLDTGGVALRFFPSHERIALEVHAGATWPLSFGVVTGRAMVQPFSVYSESPSANGSDPAPQIGFGWELGLERPRGAWMLSARARGERRSVDFRGTIEAPLSPAVRDARVTESNHSVLVTAGRRF